MFTFTFILFYFIFYFYFILFYFFILFFWLPFIANPDINDHHIDSGDDELNEECRGADLQEVHKADNDISALQGLDGDDVRGRPDEGPVPAEVGAVDEGPGEGGGLEAERLGEELDDGGHRDTPGDVVHKRRDQPREPDHQEDGERKTPPLRRKLNDRRENLGCEISSN